jgi:hypothetical protein
VWLKALLLWLAILLLAILNGALRQAVLIPAFGPFAGLIASGLLLSALIFAVAFAAVPWYGPLPSPRWWLVGALWLLLTVAFEFGFGRLVEQRPWPELLEAYTFRGGNIWPLVLLAAFVSPRLAAALRAGVR